MELFMWYQPEVVDGVDVLICVLVVTVGVLSVVAVDVDSVLTGVEVVPLVVDCEVADVDSVDTDVDVSVVTEDCVVPLVVNSVEAKKNDEIAFRVDCSITKVGLYLIDIVKMLW